VATETTTLNGTEFYYELIGEGKPLVFLHAGICDRRMWDEQVPFFAQSYRVLRYDMRGFGETPHVPGEYSEIDDLRALLDHLQLDRVTLIGCSKGGTLALDFTLLHPERVEALVIVGSNPSGFEFSDATPEIWDQLVAAWKGGDLERTTELETEMWFVGQGRSRDDVPVALFNKVAAMNLIALQNEKAGVGENKTPKVQAVDRLAEVQVPVLAIFGDHDDKPDLEGAMRQIATEVANGRMIVMTGTAHLPNMEKPDEFNQHVLNFLQSVGI
jgi:pimeloyl-ACP methyl ester carboxylesterase